MRYFTFFIAVFLLSCSQDTLKETEVLDFKGIRKERLSGEKIMDFDETWPFRILKVDSFIVVRNTGDARNFVDVFSLNSKRIVNKLAQRGSGPSEFLQVGSIKFIPEKRLLTIEDTERHRLYFFNIDSVVLKNKQLSETYIDFPHSILTTRSNPTYLGDSLFVNSTCDEEGNRFIIFNEKGELLEQIGHLPDFPIDLKSIITRQGYDIDFVVARNTSRIIATYRYSDLIEIYSRTGNLIRRVQGPDGRIPKMSEVRMGGAGMMQPSDDLYYGYTFPNIGNEHFLVLYYGTKYSDSPYNLKRMFLFDLDGNPLIEYTLDQPIITYDVDWTNRIIYGISDQPAPAAYSFKF